MDIEKLLRERPLMVNIGIPTIGIACMMILMLGTMGIIDALV